MPKLMILKIMLQKNNSYVMELMMKTDILYAKFIIIDGIVYLVLIILFCI